MGFKASADLSPVLPNGRQEREYFVVDVEGPQDVGDLVRQVVSKGISIYEVRELGNPLEDLFTGSR